MPPLTLNTGSLLQAGGGGVGRTTLELCASQPMQMHTLSLVCLLQILAH